MYSSICSAGNEPRSGLATISPRPESEDNGNLVLNLVVEGGIKDAPAFAKALKATTGVAEHGLFIALTDTLIVGGPEGPKVVGRLSGGGS